MRMKMLQYLIVLLVAYSSHSLPRPAEINLGPLGDNIRFGWTLQMDVSGLIIMHVEFPRTFTWLSVGFNNDPFMWSEDEALALIFTRHKGTDAEKTILRTIEFTEDDHLVPSNDQLYTILKKKNDEDMYKITLSRPIGTLPTNTELKLLWAYGSERTYKAVSEVFMERIKTNTVTLKNPNSILSAIRTEEPMYPDYIATKKEELQIVSSKTSTLRPVEIERGDVNSKSIPAISTTTTITKVPQTQMKTDILPDSDSSEESDNNGRKIDNSGDSIGISVDKSLNNRENVKTDTPEISTPCPTLRCNCSNNNEVVWWKDFSNNRYMAIIIAAALFTGMLTLCLVCVCAKRKLPIPKRKKHKVAFYKVDDFETDEEEIEFLKDNNKMSD